MKNGLNINAVVKISIVVVVFALIGLFIFNVMNPKIYHEDLKRPEEEYILYFTSEDCSYCQQIKPQTESYFNSYEDEGYVKMYWIDVKQAGFTKEDYKNYHVSGTPTMYYVKGDRIRRIAGGPDECVDLLNDMKERTK